MEWPRYLDLWAKGCHTSCNSELGLHMVPWWGSLDICDRTEEVWTMIPHQELWNVLSRILCSPCLWMLVVWMCFSFHSHETSSSCLGTLGLTDLHFLRNVWQGEEIKHKESLESYDYDSNYISGNMTWYCGLGMIIYTNHLCKSVFELFSPVPQGPYMDTQVVISWSWSDGERMPVTNENRSELKSYCSMFNFTIYINLIYYHSKLDISGHLTKRYIPLLYLNPGGLLMYSAKTFPVYIMACNVQETGSVRCIFLS